MDNMINVINDNLNSVINGIKNHREETEKNLAQIESEIQEKIVVAGKYKESVDKSKNIISSYEKEIADLENDLKELNEKFGGKDFTEIIAAGNKEINRKIIEKRSLITEQANNIADLTKKVELLKQELIKLTEKKDNTVKNLKDSKVLERYYCGRLNSVIDFATDHPRELDTFEEIAPDEDLVSDYDDKVLNETVDSSVFNEIEEIGDTELDENMIDTILENVDEVVEEVVEERPAKTMTEQLDDILASANFLLKKSESIKLKSEEITKNIPEETEEIKIEDDTLFTPIVEEKPVEEEIINVPVISDEPIIVSNEDLLSDNTDIDLGLDKILNDGSLSSFELMDSFNKEDEDSDNEENILDIFVEDKKDILSGLNDEDNLDLSNLQAALDQIDTKEIESLTEQIKSCGLNEDKFDSLELSKFKATFNKGNVEGIVSVLKKHDISIDVIYTGVDTVNEMTKANIDEIITNLEKTGAKAKDISNMFKYFYLVNINKLENAIRKDRNRELTEVMFEAVDYKEDLSNLSSVFNLDQDDIKVLNKSSLNNDFKIINMFSDAVYLNYKYLYDLNINNLKECFIKYPHRFILNHSKFVDIMDKYDTEDLIRCINKNAAVINRL